MHFLHISLLDGFEDEFVVIKVNGETVFSRDEVYSRLVKGCAETMEVQVEEGDVEVEFSLPVRNLGEKLTVKVLSPVYLGFSLHHGKIQYNASLQPLFNQCHQE